LHSAARNPTGVSLSVMTVIDFADGLRSRRAQNLRQQFEFFR
jgi:hypothetical protein